MKETDLTRISSSMAALQFVGKAVKDGRWRKIVYNLEPQKRSAAVFVKHPLQLPLPIGGISVLDQPYHGCLRATHTVAALNEVAYSILADVLPDRKAVSAEAFTLEDVRKTWANARASHANVQPQPLAPQLAGRADRLLVSNRIVVVVRGSLGHPEAGLHCFTQQASNGRFIELTVKPVANIAVRPCEKLVGMEAKPLEIEAPHFAESGIIHVVQEV